MAIADELLLLALDETSGKTVAATTNLDAALGAALLVELALAERISIAPAEAGWLERGKVTVINSSPTDDPDLDAVLAKLVEKDGQKVKNLISPMSWRPISKGLRDRRLARLVQQGVLAESRTEVLGLRRYPTLDPRPEHEIPCPAAVGLGRRSDPDRADGGFDRAAASRRDLEQGLSGRGQEADQGARQATQRG